MEPAALDFENLSFSYLKTDANIRYWFRRGAWSEGELCADERLDLHMAAVCLMYGQQVFEGLKVFARSDGRAQSFRMLDNARRLQRSAARLVMEPVPTGVFCEAVSRVVRANLRFLPPHGSGASLYVRPYELGISPEVGQRPSTDFLFLVFVTPVGPFLKDGFSPIQLLVEEEIDRAAPGGVGDVKCGGNYAAGLRATIGARAQGFSDVLYLDARQKEFIDEASTSNFFAVRGNTLITPASSSILPSITNMSVQQIARDMGMAVEQRPVSISELSTFDETGAFGTAAAITPVDAITFRGEEHVFGERGKAGPVTTELYRRLVGIQTGVLADPHGWTEVVE